jgi:uncharacterized membrane protein YccF (DUF307 family)
MNEDLASKKDISNLEWKISNLESKIGMSGFWSFLTYILIVILSFLYILGLPKQIKHHPSHKCTLTCDGLPHDQ